MRNGLDPANNIHIDNWKSYTVEQAAVQMLCWMHGDKRRKYHLVLETRVGYVYIGNPFLDTLTGSIEPLLDIQKTSIEAFKTAEDTGAAYEVMQVHDHAMRKYTKFWYLYESYVKDIQFEILNGQSSLLKVSIIPSPRGGVHHITRFSLEKWIRSRYKFKVIGNTSSSPKSEVSEQDQKGIGRTSAAKATADTETAPKPKKKMDQQVDVILATILKLGYKPDELPKMKSGKSWVAAEVRQALAKHPLFRGVTVFDKAWERVRKKKAIKEVE